MVRRLHFLPPPVHINPPTMARNLLLLLFLLLTLLAHLFTTTAESFNNFGGLPFAEKLAQLQFFWHNKIGPPNATTVKVADSPTTNESPTHFGLVNVIDNPLTSNPAESSQLLGKSQGMYLSVDQKEITALMVMNLVFVEGEFKGSTLSVLGRNEEQLEWREIPIVGGTGRFRFVSGFCRLRTYFHNKDTNYTVVEYHCYVLYKDNLISDL